MGSATKIMRMALHAFFSHYHPAALLALPFSAAALLSRSPAALLARPSLLPALSRRLRRVLVAAGFPPASQLLFLLNHKLSQAAFSFLATLPFSLSFLLLAKACIVRAMQAPRKQRHRESPAAAAALMSFYPAMARTQLANFAALLLANAAVLTALLAAFNAAEALRLGSDGRAVLALSAVGVIVYSVALANATAMCNLATVVAAAEGRGGCHAVLKALLLLVRGDAATAVAVALPASLATAAVEGLFQLRVVKLYTIDGKISSAMVCEGLLIAYIHSMICVLDFVITFMVYQTCKAAHSCNLLELEDKGDFIV